jgi:hypothetical protein
MRPLGKDNIPDGIGLPTGEQENDEAKEDDDEKEEAFHDPGQRSPVGEAPTFAVLLQQESSKPLEGGLSRDLLDRATEVAEEEVRRQCPQLPDDDY